MKTLLEIDSLTAAYADQLQTLKDRVKRLQDEIDSAKVRLLPGIKSSATALADMENILKSEIKDSPDVFRSPKTLILHGVKVGFQKGKGKIDWESDEHVVALIRKHFPEQADVLIRTDYTPLKTALSQLSAADLKKLGIKVEDAGDFVLVKSMDGEIDKFVKKLLDETVEKVEKE